MRLDRFISLNLVRPLRVVGCHLRLRTADCAPSRRVLPILMYHSISDDLESGVAPYYRTCTSPRVFREHLALLDSLGYRGVTLSDGLTWLNSSAIPTPPRLSFSASDGEKVDEVRMRCPGREGRGQGEVSIPASADSMLDVRCSPIGASQPEIRNPQSAIRNLTPAARSSTLHPPSSTVVGQPVAITFDDGFQDFYSAAFPLLKQHGFRATMYLPTAFIGDTRRRFAPSPRRGEGRGEVNPSAISHQPSAAGARACLTWSEVRELHAAGIEFGSHTVNHPRLVDLDWPEIESEIRDSRSELEHRLGAAVRSFAYPYAFPQADRAFAARFGQLLDQAGYESCVTTEINRPRPGDHPLRLARLPANSDDDRALLAAKLAGDYDWLGLVQLLSKKLFGQRRKPDPTVLVPTEDKTAPSVTR